MMNVRRDFPQARDRMVEEEVVAKGIRDPRVLQAMREVPRHRFVPEALEREAYTGNALPIGSGQTISAPHMVALMTEALCLSGSEKVLEVGTGSGYQAAVLFRITPRVITVERVPELAWRVQRLFAELNLEGIVVKVGDGTLGFAELAPYDRIVITAAAPHVPEALFDQLSPGGILVAPVGDRAEQVLKRYTKEPGGLREESLCRCVFVPLVGKDGFPPEGSNGNG
jgi:protein-L-isoaspartate(D-aspartate) O-methyltransferase